MNADPEPVRPGPLSTITHVAGVVEAARAVYTEVRRELARHAAPEDAAAMRDRVAAMAEVVRRVCRDRAEALYAQNLLAESRLRIERWLGGWLAAHVNHSGGGDRRSRARTGGASRDLPEGVSKNQSSAYQRLSRMSEAAFERYFQDCRDGKREITTAGAVRFAHGGPRPARRARARVVAGAAAAAAGGTSSADLMTALARSFPGMELAAGVDCWDAEALDDWAADANLPDRELATVRFLLAVSDPRRPWRSGRFDLMEAMASWGEGHRAAFLAWAGDPWWSGGDRARRPSVTAPSRGRV